MPHRRRKHAQHSVALNWGIEPLLGAGATSTGECRTSESRMVMKYIIKIAMTDRREVEI